ncbi:MAG: porin [Planctomycetaceae bacterium]|nr:porin [Planctomycetaceae bacterium]
MLKLSRTAFLLAGLAVLTVTSGANAQDWLMGDLEDPWDFSDEFLGEDSDVDIGGWTQWGYSSGNTGLFNQNPHRINNHQTWIYLEKEADGSEGLDFGGRFDVMYGTDSGDTQAFGNRPGNWDFMNGFDYGGGYGWAFPQAYLEAAYGDLSVKAGHFYTLLGYEVVTAPDNFFYSHAFTMFNSEAFTHTGVLATYEAADNVTVYGGWTAGWDTGFDQFQEGSSFLGGTSIGLGDDVTFTYITTAGDFGLIGSGYSHSIVLDFALTDDLNYVFQSDLLHNRTGGVDNETIGVNQYLFYTISDRLAVGGRAEWWKADSNSVGALTAGVNIKPHANLIIRPEIRYQWDPGTAQVLTHPTVENRGIFGVDAILTY